MWVQQLFSKFQKLPTQLNNFHILVGWGATNVQQQGFEPPTMKSQALNLIRSIRTVVKSKLIVSKSTAELLDVLVNSILVILVPLIFLNVFAITIKMLFG